MSTADVPGLRIASASGLSFELTRRGAVRRIFHEATLVNAFLGNEVEGGPANLYLRRAGSSQFICLLGPRSPTSFAVASQDTVIGRGRWGDLNYEIQLRLANDSPAWFWHVRVANAGSACERIELVYAQDLALAPYDLVRINEYYVSQYLDHTPLQHARRGTAIASRQNLAANGRHAWSVLGSLRKAASFATDALQFHGLATRSGDAPIGLTTRLSHRRLQHEHAMVVLQDDVIELASAEHATAGFFGYLVANHPEATDSADLALVDRACALPQAQPIEQVPAVDERHGASLFVAAPLLQSLELSVDEEEAFFGTERRQEELDSRGRRLSYFVGAGIHVVLRSKELHVERPHGHILHTSSGATPDERALTSTVWMNGVFNSMLTQGHVSFNRILSTQRSYLSLFRSHGQRLFVELGGVWRLLDVPSAFEIEPDRCRWIYRHAGGLIEVSVAARCDPHAISLCARVLIGEPARFLVTHHLALGGDDGAARGTPIIERRDEGIAVSAPHGSDLDRRFPNGAFLVMPDSETSLDQVGGDELLFDDGRSRGEPFLCLITARTARMALQLVGDFVRDSRDMPDAHEARQRSLDRVLLDVPPTSTLSQPLERLADILPWFTHNARIHYLAPRGLEQFTGGGWGTRDVTQGPMELLLAAGEVAPIRDLLLRVMRAQKSDGDWPQWFMFFERDRDVRAGDSHGDIVFWPLLALAQYLIASADASILEEQVPFFEGEVASVWAHAQRALALIERRVVAGTALAAYGHGDWNDALQPVDPSMREHMCSAWTVTLHHQMLTTLARALHGIGREPEALRFEEWADAVRRDFQRHLIVDDVLAGYASFEAQSVRYLLHPRDDASGVHFSSLAMIHAVLEGLFTPAQARAHLRLMDEHLLGPDGIRLFDRPMTYRGGPQRFFQRAESASFFGREIGLMYMHAHLRYAQALAYLGEAERFFKALCLANPIGIRSIVPQATLRQANCYYSSSDAAFEDRYQASAHYDRIRLGTVGLAGGWRIYSSGAGIAVSLIVRRFLGLDLQAHVLRLDPVIPPALNGLRVELQLLGKPLDIEYAIAGTGAGVTQVTLNGGNIDFLREENPYRVGAVTIARREIEARLVQGKNVMRVALG